MEALIKEHEKLVKRQKTCADQTQQQLDILIAAVTQAKQQLQLSLPSTSNSSSSEPTTTTDDIDTPMTDTNTTTSPQQQQLLEIFTTLQTKTKKTQETIQDSQKELHSTTSKLQKSIDRKFKSIDLDSIWDPNAFEGKQETLNTAILLHFIREGRFNIAESFAKELGRGVPTGLMTEFADMHRILEEMRRGVLMGALEWCRRRRGELVKRGSSLEFQLVKMEYVRLLREGKLKEALAFAKLHFGEFKDSYMKEIQKLMCATLYIKRLSKSPYTDLLDPNLETDLHHSFTRDFCSLLNQSAEPPLFTAVTVGISALPTISKMSSILKNQNVSGLEWSQSGELPVEIPLLDSQRFHSVFACPVSKEFGTDENPPMMMSCGHVVCKESLVRLSKGNLGARFKCPYCPSESTAQQAMRIYF
ncbi:hypothetical protein HDU76_008678 [Blyttiomyces sp. JEL0837]|nr:hypothetical protein HDU76_008678 [Blyttiomyces sp. JEL0837]